MVLAGALATGCAGGDEAYTLTMEASLIDDGGQMSFVTPVGSVVSHATADVVGKPYFIASFDAGFSPGSDDPIDAVWGTVPADLQMTFTTPATYVDGPYDMVFVVYVNTEIPPEIMEPGQMPPAAVAGDLATFTIDQSAALPGDPTIIPGVVRLNVAGADHAIAVKNKTPTDPEDGEQLTEAMTNTIMIVP